LCSPRASLACRCLASLRARFLKRTCLCVVINVPCTRAAAGLVSPVRIAELQSAQRTALPALPALTHQPHRQSCSRLSSTPPRDRAIIFTFVAQSASALRSCVSECMSSARHGLYAGCHLTPTSFAPFTTHRFILTCADASAAEKNAAQAALLEGVKEQCECACLHLVTTQPLAWLAAAVWRAGGRRRLFVQMATFALP
jgi:hypothetical protein